MNWHLYPIAEFKQYSESWDRLNKQEANTPLLSSDFVSPLLDYFSNSTDKLAIHGDSRNPTAMAIVRKAKFGVWETLQPSQAPLGLWLQNKAIPTASLLSQLRKALPFPTLLAGITQQDPDLLPRPVKSSGLSTLDYIQTARVSVKGSFDDYWSQRGKNLRQNLNRQRNRLAREEVQVTLKIITAAEEIPQAIVDYGRLESAGWKNAGGTAIHIDNDQGKFYRDMLINFCHRQDALIFQYHYDDRLVATDLCIKDGHSLIILKTTYDETITTSSPAMLMRKEAFEYIFNNQLVEKIEFYGKVMDWHTKWSEEIRVLYHINYYSNLMHFIK
ncbi:MAG: GNAT family N-acetyltransferase [Methylomonas sp.]|jgi:CelD/BcsL family acetyltransferase involved in cellulose biosynthesis|uniref:GNAT family N-acetyltransferase n=1 Tax=Methylomonas sp. TaxID=418 RepID=UPI0025D2966D|nr:GNAT family N-acetyltransferase [Methylomonas sp.]MCK9606067.1 GNAT family N-acetyltransferase [Methylomonas sp.]